MKESYEKCLPSHLGPELCGFDRKVAAKGDVGRVAPGDCSPGAPTDPDVQISRIRFLKS